MEPIASESASVHQRRGRVRSGRSIVLPARAVKLFPQSQYFAPGNQRNESEAAAGIGM